MKTEQDLQQRLDMLPSSIEPTRDLWPELAARLAQTPQQPLPVVNVSQSTFKPSWWLAAAAVGILTLWAPWQSLDQPPVVAQQSSHGAASSLAASVGQKADGNTHNSDWAHQPYQSRLVSGRAQATSETQWRLSSDFEQQRALQLAQIKQVPDVYRDWKQQMQIWKQATDLVLLALQYQPDEPGLLRKLSKLQQQELAYLQKVVQSDPT